MIQRFRFGLPLPTDSVVQEIPVSAGPVPFLTAEEDGWAYRMAPDAIVYGLGEMPRGINKRGWHYVTNNTDEARHSEDKLSYYGAHNFLLIDGGAGRECFGVFIDFPGKVRYDIGYTEYDALRFATEEPDHELYIITGDDLNAISRQFRQLIGRSYIPPKWAFGLAQSRFGYKTAEDVREVARQYKENDLPLDMICMDIDYMQDYADFTVNKQRFPDLAALSAELKAQGIRLVPIIDAGVRIDPENPVCAEGLANGFFCTKADGTPFVAAVWPGRRTLLYSRSSFIGSHRYGGIWLGDNASTWAQLLANIQMMPNVQLCGFLYTGADLCGFSYDTTPDLALRWLEFGLFTPLMRNHATDGSRMQEYYRFADMLPALRKMLRLRYALLPYLYSTFMKAALENTSYFRPLGFDFPADPDAREVQDQLLLGEGVMVAPVYTQNASGRHVYLPEAMKLYRIRSVDDYDTELLPAGHRYVRCALDEVLLFIRPGHAVPVARPASCTAQLDETSLTLWACPDENGSARCRMYTDDGETSDFAAPEHWKTLELN